MRKMLHYALVLTVINGIAGIGLYGVNELTRDRIAAAQRRNLVEGQQQLLPEATVFSEAKTFDMHGRPVTYYEAQDAGGAIIGYELDYAVQGYQSPVRVLSAIGRDGTLRGIKVLSQAETPGLGAEVQAIPSDKTLWRALADIVRRAPPATTAVVAIPPFQAQFAGKTTNALVVVKTKDPDRIEALSGATITSDAVTRAVREPVVAFLAFLEQQSN
jgi:electron transport complex protein RnfG